jgi:hypothetical protein
MRRETGNRVVSVRYLDSRSFSEAYLVAIGQMFLADSCQKDEIPNRTHAARSSLAQIIGRTSIVMLILVHCTLVLFANYN